MFQQILAYRICVVKKFALFKESSSKMDIDIIINLDDGYKAFLFINFYDTSALFFALEAKILILIYKEMLKKVLRELFFLLL